MAVGLEVRVPFCDHRLVEYVYNAPWALKTYDGREKSLLRGAARDVLPRSVVERVKSPYPSTQDPHYVSTLQRQARGVLEYSEDGVLDIIDRTWLDRATRPTAVVSTADRQGLEWTLNLDAWLDLYRPRLTL
jgi:asparagine synthase (glutamine-hydrolysing)